MGKASSSKKVARAARAGGSSGSAQRKLALFPIAIVAVFVLGIALVVFARSDYTSAAATAPVANQDHWHAAYGVYVCDTFKPPVNDVSDTDTTGIHTHGDGIIHTHPFVASAAGKNATLAKWGEMSGIEFGSDSVTLPDGTVLEDGYDCVGNTDTEVGVWAWNIDEPDAEPTTYDSNFGSIKIGNRMAYTIAVVPKGTTPPKPDSAADIDKLDPTSDNVVDPNAAVDPNAVTDPTVAIDPNASTSSVPQ